MDELSNAFAFPESAEDPDLDIAAIFKADDTPAEPLPLIGEPEPQADTNETDTPAAEEPSPAASQETDPTEAKTVTDSPEATQPARKKAQARKNPAAAAQAEQDIFSAFNSDDAAPLLPVLAIAPKEKTHVSLFDRPPVFSYGGHKDKIEDASQTFEELRIAKADDFPELEDGKTVSWRVKYGEVSKYIDKPKEKTIASVKEEIEKSKQFLDAIKKGKVKEPDCLVIPSVTAKSKGIADYKGVFPTVEAARESDKLICLLPAKDGHIYEMRKTEMGEFIAPKHNVVDFSEVRAGFAPALPLIPRELMGQIISFFRCFMKEGAEYEALAYIYWV